MNNSLIVKEFSEGKLMGIIRMKLLDPLIKLGQNHVKKFRNNSTDIRFSFEKKNPCESSTIIH